MSKKKLPLVGLTIHLVKQGTDPKHILKGQAGLKKMDVVDGEHYIGTLYMALAADREPSWAAMFKPYVLKFPTLKNRSHSAVLLVKNSGRWFAVTFGYGWTLLSEDVAEEKFGLRVTLNSIAEAAIRSVNVTSMEAIANHKQTQSVQHGPIRQFGIDYEQEVVRAISGQPADPKLGVFMVGKGPLAIRARTELSSLPLLLGLYLQQFESEAYKEKFDGIDQISEVLDPQKIESLDAELIAKLNDRETKGMWLGPPEVINWKEIEGFAFDQPPTTLSADPSIDDLLQELEADSSKTSVAFLKRRHLYGFDGNGDCVKKWSLYKSLHCEISDDVNTSILSNGTWFEVERNFVQKVNKAVDKLLVKKPLPSAKHKEVEGKYNKRIEKELGYQCADARSIVYGGGRSRLEFCDLYSPSREMIHVKRGTSSSTLSHLFQQGLLSATSMQEDESFRSKVRGLLPTQFDDAFVQAIDTTEFEVVYAIIARHTSTTKLSRLLPFFSRVVLKNAARQLKNSNYRVSVCLIDIVKPATP